MEARGFLYFVFMIASIIGIRKYKLNKKSLLFVAFAGIQSYLYWDTDKINSFMSIFKTTPATTAPSLVEAVSFTPSLPDGWIIFFISPVVIFSFFIFYCYASDKTVLRNEKAVAEYERENQIRLARYREERRQEYYARKQKRNNESVGDVVWGITWRAIAYAITGLWFWKAK